MRHRSSNSASKIATPFAFVAVQVHLLNKLDVDKCSVQGMSNDDIQSLQKVIDEQIQENMGMSMIYTIVSAAQEWMQDRVSRYFAPRCICHV